MTDSAKVHAVSQPMETTTSQEPTEAPPASAGPAAAARPPRLPRLLGRLDAAGALLPGALVLFFSFQAGGFFPGATGTAAGVLAVLLALRATLAERPFASLSGPIVLVAAALSGYAAWILVSSAWSDAPGRALLEFNRTLLYLLAFLLCATLAWNRRRLAVAVRGLVVAFYVVCLTGWATRVAPDLFEVAPGAAPDRLSYPLTYWNAQGLVAALGVVFAVHLAASAREPRWVRALGAAAVPLLASTLYFTFSRGAILAAIAGLVAYAFLLHSRGLLTGGLAVLPPTAVALVVSFEAGRLATVDARSAIAVAQGHDVALGVALCTVAGLVLRLVADRWLDGPLHRVALPPAARRPVRAGAWAAVLALLVAVPLALGAPAYAERQFERFVAGTSTPTDDQRTRLLNPGNNGRLDQWAVALDTWRGEPVRGTGAGTFQLQWNQHRELDLNVTDAHSLYAETLSDLGIVGFTLLIGALGALLVSVAWRGHRRRNSAGGIDRSLDVVIVAALLTWFVHAGLDWIWEMPAVTVWVFALGGIALAARVPSRGPASPGRNVRVAIGIGLLVLAVVPFQVASSQAALDESVRALKSSPQDCPRVIDAGLRSLAAVGARPEPWELIAYCDIGEGEPKLAIQAARNAIARDPLNWEFHYALALVSGAAGEDPRPHARRALELNPRNTLVQGAVKVFEDTKRRNWPRIARGLPLPGS